MAKKAKQTEMKPNANPDEIAACFSEYSSMRADVARLGQKIAAMFGRYEKLGVDQKAIKNSYTAAQKDPNEAAAQHRKNTEYLAMLEIIDFSKEGQGSFAAGLDVKVAKPGAKASAGLRAARAYTDGYNSGLAGGKIDACKFPVGSEEFVRWRDGWGDGHADRIAKNPDADKVTQSEPRKRGRPPKGDGAATPPKTAAKDDIGTPAGHA